MLTKIGQQMFLKIGQQMFHTIETDGRQAGANQQMFLTYTIETADGHTIEGRRPFVTPCRFFCLLFNWQLYHYSRLFYRLFISFRLIICIYEYIEYVRVIYAVSIIYCIYVCVYIYIYIYIV